jgi:hypothetical protein
VSEQQHRSEWHNLTPRPFALSGNIPCSEAQKSAGVDLYGDATVEFASSITFFESLEYQRFRFHRIEIFGGKNGGFEE